MQHTSSQAIPWPLPPAQQPHQQRRRNRTVAGVGLTADAHVMTADAHVMFDSPIPWRVDSSVAARLHPGMSSSPPLGSFDLDSDTLSSSIGGDWGVVLQKQIEFCRNYQCCGLNLSDLHALVEHFEEVHVVTIDPNAPRHPSWLLPNQLQHMGAERSRSAQQRNLPSPGSALATQAPSYIPSGDIELDHQFSPGSSSSPPRTSPYILTITTQTPYVPAPYSTLSSQPSSASLSPVSAFDTAAILSSRVDARQQLYTNRPLFPSMLQDYHENAIAPAMLSGCHHKAQQIEPVPSHLNTPAQSISADPGDASETPRPSSKFSRPASLLLPKPFRCPKPKCNKSYKQANGLKYHMKHGSCSSAPRKDVAVVQALLAEKGIKGDLSESDAREVAHEVERRLRPFACAVGKCARRYKNMNGLWYHYQHSGQHGIEGLGLLAWGQHECLQRHTGSARKAAQAQAVAAMAAFTERGTGTLHPIGQRWTPVVQH